MSSGPRGPIFFVTQRATILQGWGQSSSHFRFRFLYSSLMIMTRVLTECPSGCDYCEFDSSNNVVCQVLGCKAEYVMKTDRTCIGKSYYTIFTALITEIPVLRDGSLGRPTVICSQFSKLTFNLIPYIACLIEISFGRPPAFSANFQCNFCGRK